MEQEKAVISRKDCVVALRRALAFIVVSGLLAASMVIGWAWAVMPMWLRVCCGIAVFGVLVANYILCEVERHEAIKANHIKSRYGRYRV